MKKKLKRLVVGILVFVIIGIGALYLIGEDTRDRFNPFIDKEDVYVLVDKQGKPDPKFEHRYMFMLDGVNQSGEVEEIKVTSSVPDLPENSYMKVNVKGKYVYAYEIVSEHEVPENVLEVLQKEQD